jgi:hypothetical protein
MRSRNYASRSVSRDLNHKVTKGTKKGEITGFNLVLLVPWWLEIRFGRWDGTHSERRSVARPASRPRWTIADLRHAPESADEVRELSGGDVIVPAPRFVEVHVEFVERVLP